MILKSKPLHSIGAAFQPHVGERRKINHIDETIVVGVIGGTTKRAGQVKEVVVIILSVAAIIEAIGCSWPYQQPELISTAMP